MGILFTILMGFLFTITMGILFTIVLGIQFTISTSLLFLKKKIYQREALVVGVWHFYFAEKVNIIALH